MPALEVLMYQLRRGVCEMIGTFKRICWSLLKRFTPVTEAGGNRFV